MQIAQVFWDEGCQIVRLPRGFWIPANQGHVGRLGSSILITPMGGDPVAASVPGPGQSARVATEEEILAIFGQLPANDNEPLPSANDNFGPSRSAPGVSRLGRALCGWLKFG